MLFYYNSSITQGFNALYSDFLPSYTDSRLVTGMHSRLARVTTLLRTQKRYVHIEDSAGQSNSSLYDDHFFH